MPNTVRRKKSSFSDGKSNHSGTICRNKSGSTVKKEKSQGSAHSTYVTTTDPFTLHKDHQVSGDQKSNQSQHLKSGSESQNILTSNRTSTLSPDLSAFSHIGRNQSAYSHVESNRSAYSHVDSNRTAYSHSDANQDAAAQQRTDRIDHGVSISKIKLKLQDIQDAHTRIKDDIVATPVIQAKHVGKNFCNVFFKCEFLQHTGSFKARGACNVLNNMSAAEKTKGVTVCGSRNFVYSMTYYGFRQSVPVNVVVPKDCPISERQKYKEDFAIVKVHGDDANEASLFSLGYSTEIGSHYIQGWDRLDLIAGYGTMGLELLSQMDKLDAVICPVGTGGLVASLILAIKSLKPKCLIYGVESITSPTMSKALQERRPVMIAPAPSIADSLVHVVASNNAYNIIRGYLDRMITVDETWISRAMMALLEREKLLVEGAAACPVAAIMAGKVPELRRKNVVCILSGGNISSSRIARVIDRGMAAEGRLCKFSATLPDVPGAMARLLAKVYEYGADVKSFVPERAWMRRDIFTMSVNMLIETTDINHAKELEKKLVKEYPYSSFIAL